LEQMTKMKYLGALGLMLAACGGQAASDGGTSKPDQSALKKAAAESVANGTASGDPCAINSWYGDEVCDTFCQDQDSDCIPKGETATVCAEFIEAPNGICSRKEDDPCIFQDPDCANSNPPSPGLVPVPTPEPGPIVCATISETPDGTCNRPASDPCRWQDPDCVPAIACPAIAEAPDGKCSLPASDPCRGIDPDCVGDNEPTPGNGAGSEPNPGGPSNPPDPGGSGSGSAGASGSSTPGMETPPCCKH
jgi:hypothetical protein